MSGRSRDNGDEMAVYGPLASPLGPGTVRVNPCRFLLRRPASPESLHGVPRSIRPFAPCCICGIGTWLHYGERALCTPHALAEEGRP